MRLLLRQLLQLLFLPLLHTSSGATTAIATAMPFVHTTTRMKE